MDMGSLLGTIFWTVLNYKTAPYVHYDRLLSKPNIDSSKTVHGHPLAPRIYSYLQLRKQQWQGLGFGAVGNVLSSTAEQDFATCGYGSTNSRGEKTTENKNNYASGSAEKDTALAALKPVQAR